MKCLIFVFLCAFALAVTSGPCYPAAQCSCPFGLGRDLPDYKEEDNGVDVCTSVYAVMRYKECICKYVPTPKALKEKGAFSMFNQWEDDDLMLNPEY